jgi:signal transduction histidine kinase
MLVRGIVVDDDMDVPFCRGCGINDVEEADELLMAMALHALADDLAFEDVEGGEQGRGAVSFVIVGDDKRGKATRVVGINADVTERKRAFVQLRSFTETLEESVKERTRQLEVENEARLKAEALLRQAQKMEAVGQLTGGIAHDFNNLLTIVLGGLDTIGRHLQTMPASSAVSRIGRAHHMALQGAQRAVALTNRLLAFTRQQPLSQKPMDVNKLVASSTEFLQRTLGETVALETVLAAGLWRIHADPHELENALLNLALNARDAVSNNGKVTIETANCYLDESYVSNLPEPVAPGQYVMIAVADTGTGMDKTTIERAFEPFFTCVYRKPYPY